MLVIYFPVTIVSNVYMWEYNNVSHYQTEIVYLFLWKVSEFVVWWGDSSRLRVVRTIEKPTAANVPGAIYGRMTSVHKTQHHLQLPPRQWNIPSRSGRWPKLVDTLLSHMYRNNSSRQDLHNLNQHRKRIPHSFFYSRHCNSGCFRHSFCQGYKTHWDNCRSTNNYNTHLIRRTRCRHCKTRL